ncbi:MAG TPA: VC_2705 family sodium/solute symporter [Acidovorax defluvii]|jgi:cation/acetate symporter|uniref:VC_2705 family sodium/solute symporter n=1 Tax=Acidovorax sp. TaxID=1872122 RepID=UPI000DC41495|nr:VC_2705 family sodium/solute symporter [Acidovorax sp.]HRG05848.1 VC_2705 family sodium/solute symporter [Acidovorax defluvii]MBP7440263.1 VC_2705 family sodium/solute symporter [Acidovorax sp.]MBP7960052.1 VC_2705 family sodium/solute symporter [Acidovorax sp.]MBP8832286.1 VC_2705 family sodium/solute symporter [Acidovorax sp.]MBP9640243.1 VC_2705 family sodium/solute symporter [Acidovorax sp.]
MADPGGAKQGGDDKAYLWRLHRIFALYVVGVVAFLALMAWAEQRGLSRHWIGPIFLFLTVMVYAGIGVYGRTTDPEEYYVAGRRIPPIYNGMAAAADWMSAASFISLSGALYLQGFSGTPGQAGGLAYLLGWTGGFCLVALLIAPHLRAMGLYTVPDFFHVRFGGRWPRIIAALAAVLCSFTYVVAQIYGVGLIASRLTGVQFEIGIMLGLGGVLLCSFLGGMRAITWTQVAQYVVVLLAFLIPVSWLAYKQLGNPMAPLVYGAQLGKIADMEERLLDSPAEHQVVVAYLRRAQDFEARLQDVEGALEREREKARERVRALRDQNADVGLIVSASRELVSLPRDAASARERWTREMRENYERARPLGGLPLHSQAFAGDPNGSPHERKEYELARRNFLALMFCLMVGTAGLPHLLTRYYTAPSVAAARTSVAWSLFFIALLYLSAPALAVLVKFEVMQNLVGSSFETLPNWLAQWARVDASLLSVEDVNGDGLVQFGEIRLGADLIMLATPELGGLPYVVSGLVAAGGLAAALSTADGLLLTISNALVRDLYYRGAPREASPEQRVILTKFTLLSVALAAAFVAALKPAEILPLVSASFSLAASAFVPVMVLGIFWRGTTRQGAVAGMLAGLGIAVYYMLSHVPVLRTWAGWLLADGLWFGIQPISAGVFGVPAGLIVAVVVSRITRPAPALPLVRSEM